MAVCVALISAAPLASAVGGAQDTRDPRLARLSALILGWHLRCAFSQAFAMMHPYAALISADLSALVHFSIATCDLFCALYTCCVRLQHFCVRCASYGLALLHAPRCSRRGRSFGAPLSSTCVLVSTSFRFCLFVFVLFCRGFFLGIFLAGLALGGFRRSPHPAGLLAVFVALVWRPA